MAKRRMAMILALLCLCLYCLPCCAQAVTTADAKGPIATDNPCSLTITYRCNGHAFPDLPVRLYRIADVSAAFQYSLTTPFEASGLILNGVETVGEWDIIRSTLETYILAESIEPDFTAVTDQTGTVRFDALTPGLYLAVTDHVLWGDFTCVFSPALIALPGLDEDGIWQYEVSVNSKSQTFPPVDPDGDDTQLKVIKLWKGDSGSADRPKSIEVEIFRNGISDRTVTLSEEGHWTYTWSVPDDGADWAVVERNIPEGYAVTVEEREAAFVLTNTLIPKDPDHPEVQPPYTGDTSNILLYIILMNISGIMLVILGITGKRKTYERSKKQ